MFYLYVVVSATLLVQSLHSSRWNGDDFYSRKAFPQSKDLFIERTPQSGDITPHLIDIKALLQRLVDEIGSNSRYLKREAQQKPKVSSEAPSPVIVRWNEWSDWSPCSVSCGKGREIRWRRCNKECDGVEIEMHEKPCQLPACGGKLFGIIDL